MKSRRVMILARTLIIVVVVAVLAAAPVRSGPRAVAQTQETDSGTSWFGQSTLYLVFVRSFRDSDGDGTGDLQGVDIEMRGASSTAFGLLATDPVDEDAAHRLGGGAEEMGAVLPRAVLGVHQP